MKVCGSCGERNYLRPLLNEAWKCQRCDTVIDKKIERHEPVTGGNSLTAKKLQHDEYPWDHDNA